MLESLTIRNYAIIEEMTAVFHPGLNIITGETGAGKSIVVDALELVLGARASQEMVRADENELEVTGLFTGEIPPLDEILELDSGEDEPLILRREVRVDGNNRCYVNDRPVTLRVLKEIGDRLVDFHGQHDHQSLLNVAEHGGFLDGYGDLDGHAADVKRLFTGLQSVRSRMASIRSAIEADKRDRELNAFQLAEIEKADLKPGEDDDIEESIRRLSRAEDLKSLGFKLFQDLYENDESIVSRLGMFAGEVDDMVQIDPGLADRSMKLNELVLEIEDMARFFRGYADGIEDDPALLSELEDRLALIERLRKKYGNTVEAILEYRDSLREKLDRSEASEDELASLERKSNEMARELAEKARRLSEQRRETAPELSRDVEAHLAELGMKGARLVIEIRSREHGETVKDGGGEIIVGQDGADEIEFLISANPGEPPRPLVKVASGGEISRIMLALKLALMEVNHVPSMVFDEIDVGVSGRVAESIGRKLRKLTGRRQAIVITHLPQIAVMADRHFSARKQVLGDRTLAGLVPLDDETRRSEIAMLLSGADLSETALAHAGRLLAAAADRDDSAE